MHGCVFAGLGVLDVDSQNAFITMEGACPELSVVPSTLTAVPLLTRHTGGSNAVDTPTLLASPGTSHGEEHADHRVTDDQ